MFKCDFLIFGLNFSFGFKIGGMILLRRLRIVGGGLRKSGRCWRLRFRPNSNLISKAEGTLAHTAAF